MADINILGINAYHGDSSAALLQNGQLTAAAEEERFNRIKHWAGFPAESVRYCMGAGGIGPEDLDYIAVSFDPQANIGRKALFALMNRPSLKSIVERLQRQGKSLGIKEELAKACGVDARKIRAEVRNVEHHNAHIASGFLTSPFDEAAILSVDGMGDFVSTVLATGSGSSYKKLHEVYYPHSLGFLYNAITLYLGFPNYGDEYKVMGLAPYGKPAYLDEFRDIIAPKGDGFELNLDYFRHPQDGISMSWEAGAPTVEPFHSEKLEHIFGPMRNNRDDKLTDKHNDIAHSLQRVTEEIIFHLLERLHDKAPSDNVVLVGGCAMNSVANGKVTPNTPFKKAFIPVGAADNGTSFGAALHIEHIELKKPRAFRLEHAYYGAEYSREEYIAAAEANDVNYEELSEDDMIKRVIDAICDGLVVGWFQGREEFAARALGNRSLIADPRRTDMRDIINLKIKFREKFRPFAPSILAEAVPEYFELDEPSPFMEKVFNIREDKRAVIPAVTHVDGTGRLQTVHRETNPLYYKLIEAFGARTGVPILLNTSLNENEPIVHTPGQAISCFLRTRMDLLATGPLLLSRK